MTVITTKKDHMQKLLCSIKGDFLELQNVIPQRNSSVDELKERMITAKTQNSDLEGKVKEDSQSSKSKIPGEGNHEEKCKRLVDPGE